jgi:disulfide bond formation protein DsbB
VQIPTVDVAGQEDTAASAAWILVFAGWAIAAAATLGALFLSEVMQIPPCVLCWYQRIFMFPLALILPMGLFPFDAKVVRYALPLAVGGWLVAFFHVLVVAGVVPESLQPCTQGVPCADIQIQWFGFLTIPLLSLAAFTVVNALLVAAHFRSPR